jgi:hypothetical protein
MSESYRQHPAAELRVLFCFGVAQNFFDADGATRAQVVDAFKTVFDDLSGRFGATVLGTFDDDDLMVGPSAGWPWTAYILADVPDLATVKAITTLVRDWEIGPERLWKYVKIEARVGRALFFGNS